MRARMVQCHHPNRRCLTCFRGAATAGGFRATTATAADAIAAAAVAEHTAVEEAVDACEAGDA